jgi:2,4-dienoyl-CoA reductase-like NADH-dependent reductase (Old Yellow Enzyme family)
VDECPLAYAYIRDHDRVLSENVGALILTARPVLLSNPFVYAQLVRSGRWPTGRVEQMLQESRADLVIIGKPSISEQRWSQPALAALASNYHVSRQFVCADARLGYEPNSIRRAPAR